MTTEKAIEKSEEKLPVVDKTNVVIEASEHQEETDSDGWTNTLIIAVVLVLLIIILFNPKTGSIIGKYMPKNPWALLAANALIVALVYVVSTYNLFFFF